MTRQPIEPDHSSLRDVVARAIFDAYRATELEKLADFRFDSSIFLQAGALLRDAGPREGIVVSFSLASKCLDAATRFHLSHSSASDRKELLDGLGPLASDAARLKLLRVLGWLSPELSQEVDALRKIRNKISHGLEAIDLDPATHLPRASHQRLREQVDNMLNSVRQGVDSPPAFDESKSHSLAAYGIILSGLLLEEVVSGPATKRLGMPVHQPIYGVEDAPAWTQEVHRGVADAFIKLTTS